MKARWLGGLAAGLSLLAAGCNGQNGQKSNTQGGEQSRSASDMAGEAQRRGLPTTPPPREGPAVPASTDRPGGSWSGYGGNGDYNNVGNANGAGMAAADGGGVITNPGTGFSGGMDAGAPEAGSRAR